MTQRSHFYLCEENENTNLQLYMFTAALLQKPRYGNNLSVHQRMNGERKWVGGVCVYMWYIYMMYIYTHHIYMYIRYSLYTLYIIIKYYSAIKRMKSFNICNNMDGPWGLYAQQSQSDREKPILHDLTHMWSLKNQQTKTKLTGTVNRLVVVGGARGRVDKI